MSSLPTVVIAEDEVRILRSLTFIVEREGGRAVGVENGLDALAAARHEQPVCIVLDVMMPGLDGIEVTRRLRDGDPPITAPIVILTALGQPENERLAMDAGATMYFRKPFDPRRIRDVLAGFIRPGLET